MSKTELNGIPSMELARKAYEGYCYGQLITSKNIPGYSPYQKPFDELTEYSKKNWYYSAANVKEFLEYYE